MDKVAGVLEVGHNERGEIVINHPDLHPDENGVGHIVFSREQARNLAHLLWRRVAELEEGYQTAQIKKRLLAGEHFSMPRNSGKTTAILQILHESPNAFAGVFLSDRLMRKAIEEYRDMFGPPEHAQFAHIDNLRHFRGLRLKWIGDEIPLHVVDGVPFFASVRT